MSRRKGNSAEIEVAKFIEPWWRQIDPACKFVRTPLSGGWGNTKSGFTSPVRVGFKASGDLMTNAILFPWSVEVKRREAWTWDNVLRSKPSPVWDWWRRTQADAREASLEPMLWLRRSREPWRIFVRKEFVIHVPIVKFGWTNAWPLSRGVEPVCILATDLLAQNPLLFARAA